MLKQILAHEKELLATLTTIKSLIEEHNIFILKGMQEQLEKLIYRSQLTIDAISTYIQSKPGETDEIDSTTA